MRLPLLQMLAHKTDTWISNKESMRSGIDGFVDEETGKDEYANARDEAALKDSLYMPVASTLAERNIVATFMKANEIIEAAKWVEAKGSAADMSALQRRQIKLLGPSENQADSAKAYVEEIKEHFHDLVTSTPAVRIF